MPIVPPGATSVSVDVQWLDDTGAAVTGKVAADFPVVKWSGGANVASSTITLSDLAAITTAHPNDNTAGGVKEREGGWYRLDLPNNMFTTAGRKTLTFAETTDKHFVAPAFDVQYVQTDVEQWKGGTAPAMTGDAYAVVNDSTFGNAKLVRSTTPANTLSVDASHLVAVPDTQKVDVNTVKTQAVTCAAGVTFNVNVGTTQPVNFTGTGASALAKVDVQDFGGTAGTFASGRPEVNVTRVDGAALGTHAAGNLPADVVAVGNDTGGGGNLGLLAADYVAGQLVTNISGNVTGSAGSVAGDVAGKVLGGGAGTITGTGARAVDGSGAALATAATQTTISGRLPAALVGGRMDASVGAMAAGTVTSAAFATAPAETAAPGDTDIVGWLWWLLSRFGRRKTVRDATTIKVKRANGTTDWTSQGYTASGSDETVNGA